MSAIKDHAGDLGRIVICGVMIALYLGALGLAISSFTGHKSVAVAIIIVGFVISTALAYALANAIDSSATRFLVLLSPQTRLGSSLIACSINRSMRPISAQHFHSPTYHRHLRHHRRLSRRDVWRYVPNE